MALNIFFSLLMLVFSSDFASENSNVTSSSESLESTEYFVGTTGIGYGKPTAACDGTGVCFVSEVVGSFELRDNFSKAELTMGKSGNVTSIHALRSSMTKNTIKKHFSGTHFIMEDAFKGTLELKGKGLKIGIPAGKHSITKTKAGFLINIKG